MHEDMVIYKKMASLAIIALGREGLKNAINAKIIEEIEDSRSEISINRDIRLIIVTGTETFCARTDRDDLALFENRAELTRCLSIAYIIERFEKPIIAAINGDALGQGLELALACDIRIATDTAHFGFPHIKEGLIPWDGGTQRLSRVIGHAKAMEMILTGELIDAQEAYRIGLVTKVVSSQELMPVAMEMAREIASKGPIALRYAKEAVCKGMDLTLDQGLRLEADLYFLLHTTKDRTEGIRAFQEKRPPRFEGR